MRPADIAINQPDVDHPVSFSVAGVLVWARTKEHARALLDEHTRKIDTNLLEPATDPYAAQVMQVPPASELLDETRRLREHINLQTSVVRSLSLQRDALADALLLYVIGDDCGCCDGSPDQPVSGPGSCVYCTGMSALRKAGR